MQPSIEKIAVGRLHLSAAQPIIGSCNLHPERYDAPWNMHYGLEFGLVCSGKQRRLFLDKSETDVEAGDVWFCGMWEPHGMKIVAAPCEVIVLTIWPPFLVQMHFPEALFFSASAPFNAPPKQRPRTSEETRATMIRFGEQLKEIISANTPYQTIRLRFALQEILLYIFEFWPEATSWSRRAPFADFSQINQAIQLVLDSRSFVSTAAAAKVCGMNRQKFSALFRSWMNIRFADFSLKHRLHQAVTQLHDTSVPIKVTARQWGFADESHFHRLFFKQFSITPGEYRNHVQDG